MKYAGFSPQADLRISCLADRFVGFDLLKTAISPLKIGHKGPPKGSLSHLPSIHFFKGKLAVSFEKGWQS